jgi:hypothetical protein
MKDFYILGFFLLVLTTSLNGQTVIASQSFEGSGWSYTPNPTPYNTSGDIWDIVASPQNGLNATDGSNFWFMQDLDNSNGGGSFLHELTFSSQNISGFSNVTLSFDWEVFEFDNGDDVFYEVFENGIGTGQVQIVDGSSDFSASGTETINISASATSCYIVLSAEQNGGSDYGFFDNIRLEGIAAGPIVGWNTSSSTTNETNSTQTITIPVTLSNYIQNVDLDVSVTGGTAEVGDYTLNTSTLNFTGNGTQNVSIDINDDADFDDETIEITLTESTSTGINISPDVHTLTILDDDIAPAAQILITEVGDPGDNTDYRMVEICNRGSSTVDISNYSLEGDFNGNTTVDFTIDVTGSVSLAPGECFVFGNNNFPTGDLSDCIGFELSGNISTNGNETFWLNDGTSQIDVYDGFAGLDFENSAATRNSGIMDPNNTFTAVEWTVNSANAINLTPCIDPNFLPVTWIAIEAYIEAKSTVNINWQTAEERNNDHFVVQHSTNGTAWSEIGKVRGTGNSNTLQSYHFTHLRAERGANFYRIQQVDFDGSSSFSPVRLVQLSEASVEPTHAYKTYPNPTQEFIQISGREFSEINAVRLFDQWGKLLLEWSNDIPQVLPIASIPAGVYLLQIQGSNQELTTERVIKID